MAEVPRRIFAVEDYVELCDLTRADFNKRRGCLKAWTGERWIVELDDGEQARVKEVNMIDVLKKKWS